MFNFVIKSDVFFLFVLPFRIISVFLSARYGEEKHLLHLLHTFLQGKAAGEISVIFKATLFFFGVLQPIVHGFGQRLRAVVGEEIFLRQCKIAGGAARRIGNDGQKSAANRFQTCHRLDFHFRGMHV